MITTMITNQEAAALSMPNPELLSLKAHVKSETNRANNAQKDADELKQMNTQLMEEVEYLRAEKAKLEQQVAVLSEGSAYM